VRKAIVTITSVLSVVVLTGAVFIYGVVMAAASDHQDSPLTVARPGTDLTDVFIFPANDPSKVVLAMDVWPLIPTGFGTQTYFDPGVLYQFKIGVGNSIAENRVIQFKADGVGVAQTITMFGPARPGMAGTRSTMVAKSGSMPYNKISDLGNGVIGFAGPREDPFYFDLARFFQLIPDRNFANQPKPPGNAAMCFNPSGTDFLAGFNVLSIVVELPRSMLADDTGHLGLTRVWATTSLKDLDSDAAPAAFSIANVARMVNKRFGSGGDVSGTWTQVERLGRPAIKELFEAFKNHDATNRSTPYDDGLLAISIHDFMIHSAGRSEAVANAVVKTLIPDEIEADLSASGPARYLAVETNGKSGFPVQVIRTVPPAGIDGFKQALGDPYRHFGGRDPRSPVVDLSLGAVFGSLIPKLGLAAEDNRETPCLTSDHTTPAAKHPLSGFPYIGDPR
jgi:hypothetical protein